MIQGKMSNAFSDKNDKERQLDTCAESWVKRVAAVWTGSKWRKMVK